MPTKNSDGTGRPPSGKDGLSHEDVKWSSHFESFFVSGNHMHGNSHALHQASIVGCVIFSLRMRLLQHSSGESLGSLDGSQGCSIDRALDIILGIDSLDRVDDRQSGYDGSVTAAHRTDDRRDELDGNERPSSVVHQDHVDIVGESDQGTRYRSLTGLTARDDDDLGGLALIRQHRRDFVYIVRRRCNDDDVDSATCRKGANGVDKHRNSTEMAKGLGGAGS